MLLAVSKAREEQAEDGRNQCFCHAPILGRADPKGEQFQMTVANLLEPTRILSLVLRLKMR